MECIISGVPAGVGDPVFDKLDALLAQAVMSIGAVKAVEIGDGCKVAKAVGSKNNDQFKSSKEGIVKKTNHSGGILGGISDSSDIIVRASVKPTPSIARSQKTVDVNGNNTDIEILGRHDPVIVPRAVVVMESMCAITILDALMNGMTSRLENLVTIYNK
jgi:chorismate synthase